MLRVSFPRIAVRHYPIFKISNRLKETVKVVAKEIKEDIKSGIISKVSRLCFSDR